MLLCCGWVWSGRDILGFITGLLGISLVFFTGKERMIGLVFALGYDVFNIILIVSKDYRLWGDVGLNIFYAIVVIFGIWSWGRAKKEEFKPRFLSWNQRLGVLCLVAIGSILAYWILSWLKSSFLYAESMISIGCFVAFCLQVRKFVEAYLLYLFCNVISVGIWFCIFSTTPESITQLMSSIVFLIAGSYYGWEWAKRA